MSDLENRLKGRRIHGAKDEDLLRMRQAALSAKLAKEPNLPSKVATAIDKYFDRDDTFLGMRHIPKREFLEDAKAARKIAKNAAIAGTVATGVLLPTGQAEAKEKVQKSVSISEVIEQQKPKTIDDVLKMRDGKAAKKEAKQEVNPLFKRLTSEEFEQYKNSKRESISGNYKLNENDINHLTWNLFHEARGENSQGLLGVMLTVLERAKSGKFPGSIPGIIYQSKQFSWTFQNKNAFPLPVMETSDQESKMSKKDQKLLFAIHEFVKNYSKGKSIDSLIEGTKKELGISKDQKILFYKKNSKAWDENVEGNSLSEGSRKLFKKLKNVKRILNHDFYTE